MPRNLHRRPTYTGLGTLNLSRSPIRVQAEDLIAMESLTFEHDTYQKDGGATKYNTTAITGAPSVVMLKEFVADDGTKELVAATSDGKIITVDADGIAKTLKTGLTTTGRKPFVAAEGADGGLKGLYIVNGLDPMQVYTGGVATADVSDPASEWGAGYPPSWCFQHDGRMWADIAAHRIISSALDDMEDYATPDTFLTFNVYPGEGERIVGGVSWRGRAFFFKYPRGIYYLDDADSDTANWKMRRLSRYVGAGGQNSIVEALNDVFFLSPDGYIQALSAVEEFGDAQSAAILPNAMGTFIRENINFAKLEHAQVVFYATKRKVMWGVTARESETVNNMIVGLDMHTEGGAQGYNSRRDEAEALGTIRDDTTQQVQVLAGDSEGFVWQLDQAVRSKDGQAYEARFETKDIELSEQGINRVNLRELEVEFANAEQFVLDVDVHRDGQYSESVQFTSQAGSGILGSFTFGVDVLGTEALLNSRQRIRGDAHRIKLIGKNDVAGGNFSVASITPKFTPGSDRL